MIGDKKLLDSLLSRLQKGGLKVTYWDGESRVYGPDKPYFHMLIKSPTIVRKIIRNPTLGVGEAYMNGDIDFEGKLDNVARIGSENISLFPRPIFDGLFKRAKTDRRHQKQNIHHHYDLGNDFYKLWLDSKMTYSCAYFKKPTDTLEKAQEQKIDHILRKLLLCPGDKLLDIGSGWGTLLFQAVENNEISGHGITLSKEQYAFCIAETKRRGLEDRLTFELINYQDLADRGDSFDRVVSVGMFEHVGRRQQGLYLGAVDKMLKSGGISALHTITSYTEQPNDSWIDKYIFPGGHLPSNVSILTPLANTSLRLIDLESLKYHYAWTLDEWWRRFESHKDEVISMYDERFYRMWRFWLASSSAGFRYGDLDVSQYIFVKDGTEANTPRTREFIYG